MSKILRERYLARAYDFARVIALLTLFLYSHNQIKLRSKKGIMGCNADEMTQILWCIKVVSRSISDRRHS